MKNQMPVKFGEHCGSQKLWVFKDFRHYVCGIVKTMNIAIMQSNSLKFSFNKKDGIPCPTGAFLHPKATGTIFHKYGRLCFCGLVAEQKSLRLHT